MSSSRMEDRLSAYDFILAEDKIAKHPCEKREGSRLLVLQEKLRDAQMAQLPSFIEPGDLLVVNNTKVMNARIHTQRISGGKVEVFISEIQDDTHAYARIRPSRKIKQGESFELDEEHRIQCLERVGEGWLILCQPSVGSVMSRCGEIPIPPYLKRRAEPKDSERYQSVFARHLGAVAASTASLHLSETLLKQLSERGVSTAQLTLHVGMGTFAPLREEQLGERKLHIERFVLPQETVDPIKSTKARGGRVIAVGSTVTRCLESLALQGELCAKKGETDLFIQENFSFRVIDALLTNFHLPKSSLLMLVCAFGGQKRVLDAYQHAILHNYRFYSYGDAMLVFPLK